MNMFDIARKYGYTNEQARKILKEHRAKQEREQVIQEVLDCDKLEDIKILLIDWIDKGYIK
jgi:hypothetical protein